MNIIGDLEREWQHLRHHETSAAPAAAAVTIRTSTPGGPVTLLEEIETDVKNFAEATAAKFQAVDKEALAVIDAAKANPVTWSIVATAGRAAGLSDPMGVLNSIDALLKAFAPPPAETPAAEPSFTPSGPQVAGQA